MNISDKNFLKPHNLEMLEKIESLIENGEHSIFYSEATGLGKSFIFMRLVWDLFRDKKVLYIVPKIAIYDHLKSEEGFSDISDNIVMATYAIFNDKNIVKYVVNHYDAIFADEAHHISSNIQGKNIRKAGNLLSKKGGYFFGMTATPDCLDSAGAKINVKEYFDNAVIGYNITEAIENELFPNIDYTVSILEEKIVPKECKIGTNVKVSNLYLKNTINKYNISHWLVYFSNIREMKKNKKYLEKYFPEYKILTISSKDADYDPILEEYNNYDGKVMLLSVSILLEGIHIKKTGGVILFRQTRSIRVLLQILGRICNIGRKESPIFIDMLSSIRNIEEGNIIKSMHKNGKHKYRKPIFNVSAISYENINICSDLYNIIQNSKFKTVLGYTFETDADLSLQLGHERSYINNLKKAHPDWTYEDIINYANKDESNTVLGYTFTSDKDLSLQLGRSISYVRGTKMSHPDWTYEDIINYSNRSNTVLGYTFKSDIDLSLQLGRDKNYIGRIKIKHPDWTYEDIINYANKDESNTVLGYTFKTDIDLSLQLGYGKRYISSTKRKHPDWTYEDIINHANKNKDESNTVLGYTFKTDKDLSLQLGHTKSYVCIVKKAHPDWTYEDIINHANRDKVNP